MEEENFKDLENIVKKYETNLSPMLNYKNNIQNESNVEDINRIMKEVQDDYKKLVREFNALLVHNSDLLKKIWYKLFPKDSKNIVEELQKIHNLYLAKINKIYDDLESEYQKIEKNLLFIEEMIKEKQKDYYTTKDELITLKSFYDKIIKEKGVSELNKFEIKRIERGIYGAYTTFCTLEAQLKHLNSVYQQLHNTQLLINQESKYLNMLSTFLQASLAKIETIYTEFDIKDYYDILEKASKIVREVNSIMGNYANFKLREEKSLEDVLRNVKNSNDVYEKQMKNFEENMMINQKLAELGDLSQIIDEFEKKIENKQKM